jgi:hypothetical protein
MTGRLNMIRKTFVTLVAAGGLIAAAVAMAPSAHKLAGVQKADTGYSYHYHTPRHVNRHLNGCLAEPVECGLVVW